MSSGSSAMNWPKPKRVCLLLAALEEDVQPQVRQGHEILVQACSSKSGSNLFDKVVNWASNPIAGQTKEERDSATRRRIIKFRRNIEDAVKALEDDSLLFVVYTGHGELTRENYVCVPGSSFVVEAEVIKAAPLLQRQVFSLQSETRVELSDIRPRRQRRNAEA